MVTSSVSEKVIRTRINGYRTRVLQDPRQTTVASSGNFIFQLID
jgi:hypothetical protein